MNTKLTKDDIILDPNADYLNDPKGLAILMIQEMDEYREEMASGLYSETDSIHEYMAGFISGVQTVLGRMGVESRLLHTAEEWGEQATRKGAAPPKDRMLQSCYED